MDKNPRQEASVKYCQTLAAPRPSSKAKDFTLVCKYHSMNISTRSLHQFESFQSLYKVQFIEIFEILVTVTHLGIG